MSAIKDVLSRKLFSQGGLLEPEQSRNTGGILASSQPLMEAAKFANGGANYTRAQLNDLVPTTVQGEGGLNKFNPANFYLPGEEPGVQTYNNLGFDPRADYAQGDALTLQNVSRMERTFPAQTTESTYDPKLAAMGMNPKIDRVVSPGYVRPTDPGGIVPRLVDQYGGASMAELPGLRDARIIQKTVEALQKARPDLAVEIENISKEYFLKDNTPSVEELETFVANNITSADPMQSQIDELSEQNMLSKAGFEGAAPQLTSEELDKALNPQDDVVLKDIKDKYGPEAFADRKEYPLTKDEFRDLIGKGQWLRRNGVTKEMQTSIDRISNYSGEGKSKKEQAEFKKEQVGDFMDEFLSIMPEYEGKTEYEKGMDLVQLAASIGAGKSPHALQNIAEGLKESIPRFTSDDKEKREFKKQINLAAAKYGLAEYSKEETQAKADQRQVFTYFDKNQIDKQNPYGKETIVSMAEILKNGGLPSGFSSKDVVLKEIDANKVIEKALLTAKIDARKDNIIDYKEAEKIDGRIKEASNNLISSSIGKKYVAGVLDILSKKEQAVTGFKGSFNEALRGAFAAAGIENGKKYDITKDRKNAVRDMKLALQYLIPISLGSTQSANSISNRDVELLANGFLDSGFLSEQGVLNFNLNTADPETLARGLQETYNKFDLAEKSGLNEYDQIGVILAGKSGVYKDSFSPKIQQLTPYAEDVRTSRSGIESGVSRQDVYPLSDIYDIESQRFKQGFTFN
tara:strand:+ start:138 stop:2366 length:2229 start_codon:yes stop_codon:yes gene_type:complete